MSMHLDRSRLHALLQESFPHSIVTDIDDDPVSQQTILQAIAEIARTSFFRGTHKVRDELQLSHCVG